MHLFTVHSMFFVRLLRRIIFQMTSYTSETSDDVIQHG